MESSDQKSSKEQSKLLNAISTAAIVMLYFRPHHVPLEKWVSQII